MTTVRPILKCLIFVIPDILKQSLIHWYNLLILSGGFWDFTWDEMAQYDIPSMIEKVFLTSLFNIRI